MGAAKRHGSDLVGELLRNVETLAESPDQLSNLSAELAPLWTKAAAALQAAGVRMGVCTSKRVDFAVQILRMFGLLDYFDFVDGGDTGISKSMQLQSLMTAGKVDEHAVMVGDRAIDIDPSRSVDETLSGKAPERGVFR